MISKQSIDRIFATARVEEVIGDFVQLKKSGSNYKALSPFSDEKTPSFMISPTKQIWKDFSSGKGGNVVSFLMELEQFSYPEALRYLAKKYNIEIEEDFKGDPKKYEEEKLHKDSLFKIQEIANQFFQDQLWDTDEGRNIALSYFKERGFTEATLKKFQLGYSPQKKDSFTEYALEKGYGKELLEESGLSIFKPNFQVDRFRERVMFPIFSYSGRILGFGGRILQNQAKTAKYLNSPESEIYHKGKILYGLFQSKQEIVKKEVCYLVEGYTDVISLHQNGVENVVSSSGTALTQDQIKLIKRLTSNITLLFDGDAAGIRASLRSIDMILSESMNVRIVLFPEGEDPDSYAKNHSQEELQSFLKENATDFIQFKTNLLMQEVGNDPAKKAEVIRDILKSIASVNDSIQRELYIQQVSRTMEVSEEALFKDLNTILNKEIRQERRAQNAEAKKLKVIPSNAVEEVDPIFVAENDLLTTLLEFGDRVITHQQEEELVETTVIEEIIHQLEYDDLSFRTEFVIKIFDEIKEGYTHDELRISSHFIKDADNDVQQYLSNSIFERYEISPNWLEKNIYVRPIEKDIKKKVNQTLMNFKLRHLEEQIRELANTETEEEDERQDKLKKAMQLDQARRSISALLNRPM